MLIQKIIIRGAIGIKKGLGLDEIEVDFTNKTGLVALAGPNGRGKTTILELMSPYRTFASRKGALNHHFCLRDSRVETWFEFNGNQYHTIKKIDSGSDRAESFIYVNDNEHSETNGKNKEYDKYIINLFGSQVLFYNSVFCAQGSGNFADMQTGEIKKLFVEFLKLYKLAEYEAESKKAIFFFNTKLETVESELTGLRNSLEKLNNISAELVPLQDSNIRVKKSIAEGVDLVEDETSGLEALKKNKLLSDQSLKKVEELDEQVKKLELEQGQIKRDRIEAEGKHADSILEIAKKRRELSFIVNQKELIEKASCVLGYAEEKEKYFADCFECVVEDQNKIDRNMKEIESDFLAPLRKEKMILENDLELIELTDEAEKLAVKLRKAKEKQSLLLMRKRQAENDHELVGLKKDVENCKEKIAMAVSPDCKIPTCPANGIVKIAKQSLPVFEECLREYQGQVSLRVKEIEAAEKVTTAIIIELKAKIKEYDSKVWERDTSLKNDISLLDAEINAKELRVKVLISEHLQIDEFKVFYRDSRDNYREQIETTKALAGKLSDLKVAESQIQSLSTQENEKVEAWLKVKNDFDSRFEKKILEIAEVNRKSLVADDAIIVGINDEIDAAIKTIAEKNQEMVELAKMVSENDIAIGIIEDKLKQKDELEENILSKISLKWAIEKEISDWAYLKIACSKTGLQALEIDGAAPLITKEANQLLEMTFGLDFQIKIETLDPETGKEVFWVMVIRGDGDEDKFENLSGGQKVWIAKALSLGMTLVSKQKSGKAFQTLFADEEDGALDKEKALDFIGLYRSMMQAGEFDSCMYISHNPDVVAMADNILDFSGNELIWR